MNFLVASDSFKDCLSAREVGECVRRGILTEMPDAEVISIPLADGGEGTAEVLVNATGGVMEEIEVHDPLMRMITARYGILGDGKTAVIEMAEASGLERLKPGERNPWHTTTFGTGELIKQALDRGCRRIIVGLGGSATNDCGIGMASALGVMFNDKFGKGIYPLGGEIGKVVEINMTHADERLKESEIIVACDVDNPLTGPAGASMTYGPQKGADNVMCESLDRNLHHLAELIREQLGQDVEHLPGAGAAGGLGAGLIAFTGAKLSPGFEIVSRETGLENQVTWADYVITGEGRIDAQTQFGKTPMGVAKLALKYKKPVIALAGTLGEGYADLYQCGFSAILSVLDQPMDLKEALERTPVLIERTVRSVIRLLNNR